MPINRQNIDAPFQRLAGAGNESGEIQAQVQAQASGFRHQNLEAKARGFHLKPIRIHQNPADKDTPHQDYNAPHRSVFVYKD